MPLAFAFLALFRNGGIEALECPVCEVIRQLVEVSLSTAAVYSSQFRWDRFSAISIKLSIDGDLVFRAQRGLHWICYLYSP